MPLLNVKKYIFYISSTSSFDIKEFNINLNCELWYTNNSPANDYFKHQKICGIKRSA